MAGTARNWLIGCGVGCGLVLLFAIGLGTAGFFGVKNVIRRAERLDAASDSLATRFGAAESWSPPADGSLPPGRIEAFLEARRLMTAEREQAAQTFAVLDGKGGVTAKVSAGVSLVPHVLSLIEARDRALLQAGIGPGEYRFLYSVGFFGLLGKDPGDGPGFMVSSRDGERRGGDWSIGSRGGDGDGGGDPEETRRRRAGDVRETLNRLQRESLRGQLAALDAGGVAAPAGWREQLAAEVAALEAEPRRLAWEQGLPAPLRAALEPFRERLEASYEPMTGALELGLEGER